MVVPSSAGTGTGANLSQQDAAMAAAMAATNSFLYANLTPAAAALLPRIYAANSFLAATGQQAHQAAATPTSAAAAAVAGLLTFGSPFGGPNIGTKKDQQ